ncbi:Uncharacterised protein [Xylophilus ampelinus]|uniref:Uncharacterized protein n=1 Tax=Variovorax paradoxus TaxID=34073 RepID=A0A2W5PH16_VARPD|nr:hypothetical protein [Variovorax sp.]PZQ65191.1 MAG: hypothetical protein DI563_25915 [Variovorax paradoxus]VTY24933.1 Uncharacterised protein [Xylophilus ampelinus]
MELRDIAVTVRELAQGGFGWVLLEGTGEDGPFASYARLQVSERVYDSYSSALAAGIGVLRSIDSPERGPRRRLD